LPLRVKNILGGDAPDLNILLAIKSMDDLNPSNIVSQVKPLSNLYNKRFALTDLLAKLDGNDALDTELRNIVENASVLSQLQKELSAKPTAATPDTAKAPATKGAGGADGGTKLLKRIIHNGKLSRDPSMHENAKQMIAEFVNQVAAAPKGS